MTLRELDAQNPLLASLRKGREPAIAYGGADRALLGYALRAKDELAERILTTAIAQKVALVRDLTERNDPAAEWHAQRLTEYRAHLTEIEADRTRIAAHAAKWGMV